MALVLALSACNASPPAGESEPARTQSGVTAAGGGVQPAVAPAAAPVKCDHFADNLTNRDWAVIYHAMTGLQPPREQWADEALVSIDRSVGAEDAWKRANALVDAQWNAMKDTRCITLRTNASPGDFDPGLGGIPFGAFAPDAYYPVGERTTPVSLSFRNAGAARVWKMPADRAAALRSDSWLGSINLVIRARLVSARPSGNGGAIEAEIVSFDLEPSEYSSLSRETFTVAP
jgi:hypothetical protein